MRTLQPALIILFMGVNVLLITAYLSAVMGLSDDSLGKSSMKVDSFPVGVAVNTATNKVYVTNYLSNTLSVIDGENNDVKDINVGSSPYGVAVNEITNRVYVSNLDSNSISVIDGSTLT